MKKTLLATGLLISLSVTVQAADFSIRGGNQLRWARGNVYLQGTSQKDPENWFENVTNLSATYGNLQLYLRHSLFRPSEFGEQQGGIEAIDFKQLEFRYADMTFTAGNFYATVGRGLALNLYQDYALNFDSNLEGFKYELNKPFIGLLAFQGRSYASTSPEGSRVRENDLMGAALKGSPFPWGTLSGYYFYTPDSDTSDLGDPLQSYPETRIPGGFVELNIAEFGLYAETTLQYVKRPPDVSADDWKDPYYGNYVALDFSIADLGLVADFKDYNFKKFGTYTSGAVTSSEPLAYQNPPIVQREFTTNLLAKHPHVPVFEDEVGFQIEGTYQLLDPLGLVANFSRSSRHRDGSLIPSLHEVDAPFWQLFIEGEYVFPESHFLRLDMGVNEEVVGLDFWERKQAGAAEGTYYFSPRYSGSAHLEAMRVEDVRHDEEYLEFYAALTGSRAPWGSVTLVFETTGDPNAGDRDNWVSAELDLNFLQNHNLLLFVGQDRGGLKCTSGRCRYVDPFEGVKLGLRSTF
jgi:hypothetical protein